MKEVSPTQQRAWGAGVGGEDFPIGPPQDFSQALEFPHLGV